MLFCLLLYQSIVQHLVKLNTRAAKIRPLGRSVGSASAMAFSGIFKKRAVMRDSVVFEYEGFRGFSCPAPLSPWTRPDPLTSLSTSALYLALNPSSTRAKGSGSSTGPFQCNNHNGPPRRVCLIHLSHQAGGLSCEWSLLARSSRSPARLTSPGQLNPIVIQMLVDMLSLVSFEAA